MRHPPTALLAAGLLALALPLAGCAFTPAQKARQQQEQSQENARKQLNETERQRLTKEIGRLDHVTTVDVGYTDTWPEKGAVSIGVKLPLADRNEQTRNYVNEEATKAAWLSRIHPLDRIVVRLSWHNPGGPGANDRETPLLGDTGRARLTRRYGPRPRAQRVPVGRNSPVGVGSRRARRNSWVSSGASGAVGA